MNLCKKESQVKSKKTAFSQESQQKVNIFLTYIDFLWLKAIFWLYLTFFFTEDKQSQPPLGLFHKEQLFMSQSL